MIKRQANTFPDSYANVHLDRLLQAYAEGPQRVERCIEGLDEKELKRRVIRDKWTIFEILIHIADSELTGAARIRQCYSQSDTRFPFYNQDVWAEAFDYQGQAMKDLNDALLLFRYLRKSTLTILLRCDKKDWAKTGLHPEAGKITLRNLLELYADHSERHLAQIVERRRLLNKPAELPMILEQRLY